MSRLLLSLATILWASVPAVAGDIYTAHDEAGVPKLTNVPSPGAEWRRLGESSEDAAPPSRRRAPEVRPPYAATVERVARHYGVESALVHAVIQAESAYDPAAVSPRGAIGLMQLLPATAAEVGISDPREPHANIVAGVRHLRRLLLRYRGNVELTLAAYNAGPAAVERYRGIPPYPETRAYVRRIRARYDGPGLVAPDDGPDEIIRYVDSGGTVVFTQFPDRKPRSRRSR